MADEKKIEKLSDEELDSVVGGTQAQAYSLCLDLDTNCLLKAKLNNSEKIALNNILKAGKTGNMDTRDTRTIEKFLANKLGLDYVNFGWGSDAEGGKVRDTIDEFTLSARIRNWGR